MTNNQFQSKLSKFLYSKGLLSESEFWNQMDESCEHAFNMKNCELAKQFKDFYFANVRTPHAEAVVALNSILEQINSEWAEQIKNAE
jgi:hypothetical protein